MLVVLHRFLPLFSTGDAGAYPFVFQCFSEPIGVVTTISEQPINFWQAANESSRANVIADLTGCHKEVQWAPLAVAEGVQLCVSPIPFS